MVGDCRYPNNRPYSQRILSVRNQKSTPLSIDPMRQYQWLLWVVVWHSTKCRCVWLCECYYYSNHHYCYPHHHQHYRNLVSPTVPNYYLPTRIFPHLSITRRNVSIRPPLSHRPHVSNHPPAVAHTENGRYRPRQHDHCCCCC